MWDLFWSVCFSSLIFVVFKLYKTYGVATFQAIVVNYFTAFLTGLLLYSGPISLEEVPAQSWIPEAVCMGFLFVTIFNLMARTSQRLGVSVASIATKMSLVIPVLAGILLYGESLTTFKFLGICLALIAVYFASVKQRNRQLGLSLKEFYLPFLVFLGSGIIDASIKYMEATEVSEAVFPLFSACIFFFAGLTGLLILLVKSPGELFRLNATNLIGGVALGVPNFFSIYFLLRALQYKGLNSASLFALNNVSIVLLTTLLGVLIFEEKLTTRNWGGVALSIVSILFISFL